MVKWTEHAATPGVPATRVQVVESKVPCPSPSLKVTVPDGLVAPVVLVSVTVAVHVEAELRIIGVMQTRVVEVKAFGEGLTVMSKKPELPRCLPSPGKLAVIL